MHLCLLRAAILGFACRNLLMEKYTGWYSWAIRSLTACAYALGFILMIPQVYINYKVSQKQQ
jgi:hypothetical protein